jgi:hypothetical protein
MVKVKSTNSSKVEPLNARPLVEVTRAKEEDTGEDVYLVQENEKHQFSAHISPLYGTKEYYYTGVLYPNKEIQFVHNDGKPIPLAESSNCGYTLVGNARKYFSARRALVTDGESSDDQEYVYITPYSQLFYTGDEKVHTIFLRIYDNINGLDNDRWVVIYIE